MKINIVVMFLLITFFSTAACSMGGYSNISGDQAKEMLKTGDKDILLLDVRTEREFKEGHIAGAKLIPVSQLAVRLEEITSYKDKKVIIYCAVGGRSGKASTLLQEKGFKYIYNLDGGIVDWDKKGFEIVK